MVWPSLLPIALVAGGALVVVAASGESVAPAPRRLGQAGVAAAVAALFLGALGVYGRTLTPDEHRSVAAVRQLWEPVGGTPDLHRRP